MNWRSRQTQPEQLERQIAVLLPALMSTRTIFIGTPIELSEKIDPVGAPCGNLLAVFKALVRQNRG